ncbi:hypothetical protein QR680_010104 [Steinernema hermaphroditum]|uniref:Uncharacterized protein n=1 Tax=Steinernema hermaphroditum TaxID=289476 RepID=A0AA39MAY1_9BILA|nr:hypothetical protein QR680_010104 [Steinernema hermaphroditum]
MWFLVSLFEISLTLLIGLITILFIGLYVKRTPRKSLLADSLPLSILFLSVLLQAVAFVNAPLQLLLLAAATVLTFLALTSANLYFIASSYRLLEHPFAEACYAFNCLGSLGPIGRASDFYIRMIGSGCMIVTGCVFLVVFIKGKNKIKSLSDAKLSRFVKYMFIVRTSTVVTYFVPDYIMSKTVGKNLSDFIGPYAMMCGSLDGLLTAAVYYYVTNRKEKKVFVSST